MDPLTVIGAVGGLVKTTASFSSTIARIVSARNKGSSEIIAIKNTIDVIRSILQQLQILLLKQGNIDPERASMLFVGDIVAILTSCVLTMSNLEGCIAGLKVDDKLGLFDSIRWNSRMSEVRKYRGELEASKTSLNLVLTIMTCQSVQRAEISATELKVLVVRVLEGNLDLTNRMSIMQKSIAGSTYSHDNHDTISIADTIPGVSATANDITSAETVQSNLRHPVIRAFEEELNSSWVCQKSRRWRARARPFSIASSAQLTQTWSLLSELSLSGISNLSVWALPIQKEDLINSDMYWSENGKEFKIPSKKESSSIIDDYLPQLPEVPELEPMFGHFGEEEQALVKRPEASESLSEHQSEMSPARSVLGVTYERVEEYPESLSEQQSEISSTTSVKEATYERVEEYPVLYLAASLFDFHLDVEKFKGDYSWLLYAAGDVFDVLGEKGDLWLAANQDDPRNKVGWLWSKHFARLPSDVPEQGLVSMRNIPLGEGYRIRQTIQEDKNIPNNSE
ncbi:hypothetical protein BDZ45DRAFT_805355 [Acephala macrosclerotiorum]|nr:hypothetical protein BDZ45DRAFT_805355 [Acephala macrosclerotiorum]